MRLCVVVLALVLLLPGEEAKRARGGGLSYLKPRYGPMLKMGALSFHPGQGRMKVGGGQRKEAWEMLSRLRKDQKPSFDLAEE